MSALLELRDVSLQYPGSPAPQLEGISMEVEAGDRLLVVGPSGCGKSSLLLLMSGLVPDPIPAQVSGTISRIARDVGIVFQNPDSQMVAPTVLEEVAFGLENRGEEPSAIRGKAFGALERLGIAHLASRATAELSGGEKQKVVLAAAIAGQPDILLLDEPTANLDPDATDAFFSLLRSLPSSTAIVIVEHKLDEAVTLARRFIRLEAGGKMGGAGSVEDITRNRSEWMPWGLKRLADGKAPQTPGEGAGPLIEARDLSCSYSNGKDVLKEVSLSLLAGEIVSVMGPNGAGKSTLLNAVAGLIKATRGTVTVCGLDVRRGGRRQLFSHLMLMPQNPEHLFLRETVADELAIGSTADPSPHAARFGLQLLLERSPFRLSEGEKRRLNLACAFVDPREILLLDEPTYGLDYGNFASLVEALREARRARVGALVVTHSPELAFLVSDRVLRLQDGRLLEVRHMSDVPPLYRPVWARVP